MLSISSWMYKPGFPKDNEKLVGSFYCSRKTLIPSDVIYLYLSQIMLKIEFGIDQSSFSSLDRAQNVYIPLVEENLFTTMQL